MSLSTCIRSSLVQIIHPCLCKPVMRCYPIQMPHCLWRREASSRGGISRSHRKNYLRTYPCMLVQPDGSTITIRYKEPRCIIKLPKDLSHLSEEEKQEEIRRSLPKERIVVEEEVEDTYDSRQYIRQVKARG